LALAGQSHGHMCPGQVLGIRMAMLGLGSIGIDDPVKDRKRLLTFVEIDRCATDAVSLVTGCRLGKRSLKFLDYGKVAATFVNVETGRAVRVVARDDSRAKAKAMFPALTDSSQAQLEAYKLMENEDLFNLEAVRVKLKPEDLPDAPTPASPARNAAKASTTAESAGWVTASSAGVAREKGITIW